MEGLVDFSFEVARNDIAEVLDARREADFGNDKWDCTGPNVGAEEKSQVTSLWKERALESVTMMVMVAPWRTKNLFMSTVKM